ncbi:MAG TPA: acyltransferase [Prolixibacteraceae bacterium]|nr:acyltransferase [Prolixibacteraceae bacterium]
MTRAYYIDRLRILLTMLVIFHHSAIAFGASGGWYYMTPNASTGVTQMVLSLFMAIDQAFFMSFFFFISALLMPDSYDRKGFGRFIKDRFIRLGIPLAVYTILLHPTLVYGIHKYLDKPTGNYFGFVWTIITKYAEPGPMWFVLTLLIFELIYALVRHFTKNDYALKKNGKLPSALPIIGFILGTGALAFVVRLVYPTGKNFFGLQFGYFVLYIAMYTMGLLANHRKWIDRLTVKNATPWFVVSLVAILVNIVFMALNKNTGAMNNFAGGMNLSALTYALWEPFICVGFCFFLLMYFKEHLNKPSKLVLAASCDSYAAYIIHPLIVVGFTFLSEKLTWSPLARLAFVLLLSIPTCFLAARVIRKIPGVKRVL